MQLKNSANRQPYGVHIFLKAGLLAALTLLAACGPDVIKGRPPMISISSMALEGGELSADFDIRNENGVAMNISAIDITMTVQDTELTRYNEDFVLEIAANSAEEVNVDALPDEFTRALLKSLQDREVKSLPFTVEGRVNTLEDGFLKFANKGHLYPVPGRPNEFRAAVTHSEGLTRERVR